MERLTNKTEQPIIRMTYAEFMQMIGISEMPYIVTINYERRTVDLYMPPIREERPNA